MGKYDKVRESEEVEVKVEAPVADEPKPVKEEKKPEKKKVVNTSGTAKVW